MPQLLHVSVILDTSYGKELVGKGKKLCAQSQLPTGWNQTTLMVKNLVRSHFSYEAGTARGAEP